jgi:hypothetical protein
MYFDRIVVFLASHRERKGSKSSIQLVDSLGWLLTREINRLSHRSTRSYPLRINRHLICIIGIDGSKVVRIRHCTGKQ